MGGAGEREDNALSHGIRCGVVVVMVVDVVVVVVVAWCCTTVKSFASGVSCHLHTRLHAQTHLTSCHAIFVAVVRRRRRCRRCCRCDLCDVDVCDAWSWRTVVGSQCWSGKSALSRARCSL